MNELNNVWTGPRSPSGELPSAMLGGVTEVGTLAVPLFEGDYLEDQHTDSWFSAGLANRIRTLMDRDGSDQVLAALLRHGSHGGWTTIGDLFELDSTHGGVRIPGYGRAHADGAASIVDPDAAGWGSTMALIEPDGTLLVFSHPLDQYTGWRLERGQRVGLHPDGSLKVDTPSCCA